MNAGNAHCKKAFSGLDEAAISAFMTPFYKGEDYQYLSGITEFFTKNFRGAKIAIRHSSLKIEN
jgi:hypothetical protein